MSKIIKSSFSTTNLEAEKKTIAIKRMIQEVQTNNEAPNNVEQFNKEKTKLIDEELKKAKDEAETIKNEAKLEYEQFQSKMNEEMLIWQQKSEELFKQAEENGYNEGFQQGLQEGQKQYEAFIEQAKAIVNASRNDYYHKLEEAEPIIVQLALKVAEKVISTSIDHDEKYILSIVKTVINEVREQEQVKLYIPPNWFEYILAHKEELKLLLPNCDNLYVYPDPHLEENGCQIETRYGKVDASIDSQLTEIKYALLEKIRELGGNESR